MSNAGAAIEVRGLRKKYGERAVTRARLLETTLRPGGRDPMQPLEPRRVGPAGRESRDAPET